MLCNQGCGMDIVWVPAEEAPNSKGYYKEIETGNRHICPNWGKNKEDQKNLIKEADKTLKNEGLDEKKDDIRKTLIDRYLKENPDLLDDLLREAVKDVIKHAIRKYVGEPPLYKYIEDKIREKFNDNIPF
jgi:hypothetical protein